MSTLGTRIKEAREQKSLLQSDLAKLIGVKSSGVISNWEKDLSKPDANKIVKLCQALDVSASYLLDYFGDDDFEIMPHEIELIKNYRSLDNHGKEIVTLIVHKELIVFYSLSIPATLHHIASKKYNYTRARKGERV